MSGHEVAKDELREQFTALDVNMSEDIDKEELKQAMMTVDLAHFGWDLNGEQGLLNVQFEEMDVSRNGLITWTEVGPQISHHNLVSRDDSLCLLVIAALRRLSAAASRERHHSVRPGGADSHHRTGVLLGIIYVPCGVATTSSTDRQ